MKNPPDHLDDIAQAYWLELAEQVGVTSRNVKQLETASEAYSTFRHCIAAIQNDGMFTMSATGQIRPHPATGTKERAVTTLNRILKQLYQDAPPTAEDQVDEIDKFHKKHGG